MHTQIASSLESTARAKNGTLIAILTGLFIGALAGLGVPRAALAQSPAELYQRSYDEEAAGSFAAALSTLGELPTSAQESYLFALRRAWLLYLAQRHAESVAAYDAAIARAPGALEPLLGKTLPLIALGRWRDVVRTCEAPLRKDRRGEVARSRLALALYQLGRFEKSRKVYAALLRDYPSRVDLRAGLGWALLKLGRRTEALRELEAVLAVAPRHASASEGWKLASVAAVARRLR